MIYSVADRENLSIAASVVTPTASKITDKVIYARVQVQVASIRVTSDGTNPDPSTNVGEVFNKEDFFEVWGERTLKDLKMIRETTTNGRVEVTYMGAK